MSKQEQESQIVTKVKDNECDSDNNQMQLSTLQGSSSDKANM